MRKVDGCVQCGEQRDIAARGLCFTCYRRWERAQTPFAPAIDRHSSAIRKHEQKLYAAYSQVMIGLGKLGLSGQHVQEVIRVIRPYLEPIASQLRLSGETVNGEHESGKRFTVHTVGENGGESKV